MNKLVIKEIEPESFELRPDSFTASLGLVQLKRWKHTTHLIQKHKVFVTAANSLENHRYSARQAEVCMVGRRGQRASKLNQVASPFSKERFPGNGLVLDPAIGHTSRSIRRGGQLPEYQASSQTCKVRLSQANQGSTDPQAHHHRRECPKCAYAI